MPHSLRICRVQGRLKTTDDDSQICVEIYYRQISAFCAYAVISRPIFRGVRTLVPINRYMDSLSAHDWISKSVFSDYTASGTRWTTTHRLQRPPLHRTFAFLAQRIERSETQGFCCSVCAFSSVAAWADMVASAPFRWWRFSFFVRDRLGVFRRSDAGSVLGRVHLCELCAEKKYQR